MRLGLLFLAALGGALLQNPAAAEERTVVPKFVEETESAGLDSAYTGEWEYMVGGGAATFDCDSDGFPDLLVAGGTSPAKFYRNASEPGSALQFQEQESGLELEGATGAYPFDVDSDGITDLIVLRVGENIAMRGLGACRFERANERWGFDGGGAWSTALAATWEHGAEWPTIAVGNYIDRREQIFPWGSCTDNWLHRPAEGVEDKFASPLPLKPSFCALSMLFTDWSRSGTPSLRISNDREYYKGGQEQLWRIAPGEAPTLFTEADGWQRLLVWGMGIASYDLDFDGYPEYFLTSMADNKLQTLADIPEGRDPRPAYTDVAFAKGVTAHRPYTGGDEVKPSTAWHAAFEDVNNDGLADLFVAKGNVWEMPDFALKDPNNLLVQQTDSTFEEAGEIAGVASFHTARGAALTDFNLDGLIDLVVVNRGDKAQLWRNVSQDTGHWVQVKLQQPGANPEAIGAWVEVRRGATVIRREITVGGGHAGGHIGWHHFGLGSAARPALRVLWPDGSASDWQELEASNFYIVKRGEPAEIWAAD
ncbi:CRTAC1 family protein [Chelativorans sp. YIM 93263]|uniref:CRTAC1 family protein n=1 Tax=Chelativorans sp. YIM 93263 TaxID=2906648 RepID=UPI002378716F|nr:CRTAC1 family protein [Chelativorans sp. YIM 93263]